MSGLSRTLHALQVGAKAGDKLILTLPTTSI